MNLLKNLKLKKHIEKIANNNITALLLLIVVISGIILRIYKLGSKSLWVDEIGQVLVSKNTIPEVLEGVSQHLSPPLDYIILHFFLYFADSEFMVRLPSAIFGILAIILIYKVGKMLFGTKEGLISAFLLSISPMHVWYSQEARMYSLFILPVYIIVISKGITSISQSIVQLTDELTSKVNIVNWINKELIISFIIIMLFASVSIVAIGQGYAKPKEDWSGTADYLTTHVKEGELIVTSGSASHLSFYYEGDADIISTPKNITSVNIVNTASGNYAKIWFVSCPHSGVDGELLNWLDSNCILEIKGSPGGGEYLELGAIYSYSFD